MLALSLSTIIVKKTSQFKTAVKMTVDTTKTAKIKKGDIS